MDKYIQILKGILESMAEGNPYDQLIYGEEYCNLLMDKVPISDDASELASTILEEFKTEFHLSKHIKD